MVTEFNIFKRALYRFRVDCAHERADALQLPAPGTVRLYFAGIDYGLAQFICHVDACKLFG